MRAAIYYVYIPVNEAGLPIDASPDATRRILAAAGAAGMQIIDLSRRITPASEPHEAAGVHALAAEALRNRLADRLVPDGG